MIKKILIALFLIVVVGYGLLESLSNATDIEWGHHFTIENELGVEIDSLEIIVGNVKTVIEAGSDSLRTLEGNISVPPKGYPHKVIFKIYSNEKSIILKADSFDCYNCDGYHEYTLKESGAEYTFIN